MSSEYTYVLSTSTDEVNAADWDAVCNQRVNPYMDLRFSRAVERSIGAPSRYWYAIFYDRNQRPMGCACFSLYWVDGGIFAPPVAQRVLNSIRRLFPKFFKFRVLIQGLPVSTGDNQLSLAPEADPTQIVPLLHEIAGRLAREGRAEIITFKELDEPTVALLGPLEKYGYRLADALITWTLRNEFTSFDDYYASRSKRTRANMRKYIKRFEDAGLRVEHRQGGEEVAELITDEVHRLYLAVLGKASVKFEILPREFFQEVARQLPDRARYTFVYQQDRIVGFVVGLNSPVTHFLLYCGVDYELNEQSDLYFNLLYQALGNGIGEGSPIIRVGASADEFKKRLGTTPKRLYFYVKSARRGAGWLFNLIFPALFPAIPPDHIGLIELNRQQTPDNDSAVLEEAHSSH